MQENISVSVALLELNDMFSSKSTVNSTVLGWLMKVVYLNIWVYFLDLEELVALEVLFS